MVWESCYLLLRQVMTKDVHTVPRKSGPSFKNSSPTDVSILRRYSGVIGHVRATDPRLEKQKRDGALAGMAGGGDMRQNAPPLHQLASRRRRYIFGCQQRTRESYQYGPSHT